MDAQAYLIRHGWAGPGNPLNPSRRLGPHAGLGLSKPILVARRSGNEGVGKKTTKDPTNQWWLRGFEDALKGVGQENAGGAGGDGGRKPNALTSELYRFFVRGEGLAGSIGVKKDEDGKVEKKEKRKRGEEDDGDGEEKKASQMEKSKKRKTDGSSDRKESKEERRRRKEEKKLKKEAKENKKAEKAASKEEKKTKKAKKESKPEDDYPTPTSTGESNGQDESVEVKAPSKERKNDKKDKKDKKDKSKKSKSESTTSDENATHKSKKEKKERKEKKKSTKE